jgi:L-threonylcarbamoyladenylate synthase
VSSKAVAEAVAAIRAGKPVVLPFDTVYGLAAEPYHDASARRLYRLKGREATQPTALVASSVDELLECLPELRGRAALLVRALLPGPLTLVVPNPARRYRWVTGTNAETLGVRVPDLDGPAAEVLDRVGAVIATSANHPGGPDPHRVEEVPADIRAGAAAVVDGGELPGTPSTVIDLTAPEPRVLREGALPADDALRRLGAAVRSS